MSTADKSNDSIQKAMGQIMRNAHWRPWSEDWMLVCPTPTGLDLKWWLTQFLQVGCHSDPLLAFIFATNESLGSQGSPGGRHARQLLSCCSSGWHNATVERQGFMGLLQRCVCGGVTCGIYCDLFCLELTYLWKRPSENRYCIIWLCVRDCPIWKHSDSFI